MAGRSGGRNWVPGLFAAFWILLAVFSAAYLFRIITEPQANRETASASTAAPPTSSAPPAPSSLPTDQAQALVQANEAKDQEIGQLKAEVRDLSGQVTELSNRLKPLEKVLGPVAALPSSTAVTTSPPSPEPVNPSVANRHLLPRLLRPNPSRPASRSRRLPPRQHGTGPRTTQRLIRSRTTLPVRRPARSPRNRQRRQISPLHRSRRAPRASASRLAASPSRMRSGRCGAVS